MTAERILEQVEAVLTPAEFQAIQIQMECGAHGDFKQLAEAAGMNYDSAKVLLSRARKKLTSLLPRE
ncbi:MAG TPA: hypothetical protein VI855_09105 [Dehalococcoidia bacterium]|nr:hypothetical protein [Dehalococcoidia bacterium]